MTKGIEDVQQDCLECGQSCKNRRSLGNHVARSHKDIGDLCTYYLKHISDGKIPQCECGCGQKVSWHKVFYRFNTYVSGHNESGFTKQQPKFTKQQIERRNDSIRKAYTLRGEEIKKKISDSVSKGLKESEIDFSSYFSVKWQDENFRDRQRESRIASWSGPQGEARRRRVFTSEFGRKISMSNMARDVKRISKAEEKMIEALRSSGLDVIGSKWFNFEEKTWCADAWIPSTKAIVELDGTYWHAFDRSSSYTREQIVNMTNDLIKNKLAKTKKLNLLRIRDDALSDCSSLSFSDLESRCHHIVRDGEVMREGSPHLSDTQVLISRNTLISECQKNGKEWIEKTYLTLLKDFFRAYVDYWGWFMPTCNESIEEVFHSLDTASSCLMLSKSTAGSAWLKSRVRSFWEVDHGPIKSFFIDSVLRNVLLYRLGINNSKPYDYVLDTGERVTCNETFDISLKNIRTGFLVQRNKVSWFKPQWAAVVYRKYLSGKSNPVVWDPSIGFSARLLAFCSLFEHGKYIGTEPSRLTFESAVNVATELEKHRPNVKIDLRHEGSERARIDPNSLDLVFTSPPYFDTEKYFDEPGQCWRDYSDFEIWVDNYLVPTMKSASLGLKPDAVVVINVSDRFKQVVVDAAIVAGLKTFEEIPLPVSFDHFSRKRGKNSIKHEVFLVFKRS